MSITIDQRLSEALHNGKLSRGEKLLVCLAVLGGGAHTVAAIKTIATNNGISAANVARDLGQLKGLAFLNANGWSLTTQGRRRANEILEKDDPVAAPASALRALLPKLNEKVRDFVLEALACHEAQHYRAAVVLSWVGAVSVLYAGVVKHRLADFNKEALRRDAKWRTAKTEDDLARMKEYDFLQVIESLSIIGKNVKQELEGCLTLRNGCGHPNSLKIAAHRSASHLEVLVLNVFTPFC